MMPVMQSVTAFVLAGGKSSRMGRDKAGLVLAGKTLLERAVQTARAAGAQVCIVGAGQALHDMAARLTCSTVGDAFPGQGPLAGIHAALASAHAGQVNFILAVDIPFVTAALLQFVLSRAKESGALATLPHAAGRIHPLCAVYRREFAAAAQQALAEGNNKIEAALHGQTVEIIGEAELVRRGFHAAMLANLNTPEEFAEAERRVGCPQPAKAL